MSRKTIAATKREKISVHLNKELKITVDGQAWMPRDFDGNNVYPIIYNGMPYLPFQIAGDAVGLKVVYDEATSTVMLGETPSEVGTSSFPAAKDEMVLFKHERLQANVKGTVKLQEVIRGSQALEQIQAANQFNSAVKEGQEYILARVEIRITKNAIQDTAFNVNRYYMFECFSAEGKKYEDRVIVVPNPDINNELYVGASHTGWVAFQIDTADPAPLLVISRNDDGTGGAWIKLQ